MRVFLISIFSVIAISSYSQNKLALAKSDSLFAIGVELYNKGNYKEAIPLFSESDRIDKAELDSTSNRRDYSAMWLASCYFQLGDSVKAEEINEYYNFTPIDRRLTVVPDSLSEAGIQYFKKGLYDNALSCFIQCANIEKEVAGDKHIWYANILNVCRYVCAGLERYEEAIKYGTEYMEVYQGLYGTENSDYATILSNLAKYNAHLGNYSEAIRLGTEVLEIQKKVLGTEHPDYATSLVNLARYNASLNNYSETIRLGSKGLEIWKRANGTENSDYATILSDLAICNSYLGNYSEAIRLGTEVLEIQKKVLGTEHPDYATSLVNLAHYNASLGNYSEAILLGTEALEIQKKVLGTEHPDYAISLVSLSNCNASLGNYSEAIRLGTEALEIWEKVYGTENSGNATILNSLSNCNASLGNYSEAIRLGTEALEIWERAFGKEHSNYATILSGLANYNSSLGNYSEAIRLGTEALEIRKKVLGTEHPDYAISLSNLASYNSSLGNYSEAIRLGTEALEIQKKVLGTEHPDYATSLNNLANLKYFLSNYSEAIQLGTEALGIWERAFGKEHPNYATILNGLAIYNSHLGNYSEAIRLGTEALEIQKKVLGTEHPDYATSLNNLATYNANLTNYSEAIRLGTEALEIRKKVFGTEHPDYATSLSNLAYFNYFLDNYSEAIQLDTEAIKIWERVFGKENPNYVTSLNGLVYFYWKQKNVRGTKYCIDATQLASNLIKRTFTDLTNKERKLFWEKYKKWFEKTIHQITLDMPSDSLYSNGFNGILLSKGLLLNSEIEFSTLLKESGDREIEELYNNLKLLRFQINRQLEKPITERALNVDSLSNVAEEMERTLMQRSKVYGDYTKNLVIKWQQVQEKLGEKDIAIEFVSFPTKGDSIMYVAYCLRKRMPSPQMYPLFEAKQLKDISKDAYTQTDVSQLVWKPLIAEMKDVDNVYFSPSGELYNIAIESIPYWEEPTRLVSERWNLYRLSSTRELALIKDKNNIKQSVVYGGLKYDTDTTTLINNSKNYATTRDFDFFSQNIADSLNLRSGVQELPETKIEVLDIDKKLARIKVVNKLYTDTIGTETSFKALSGQKRNLLHIATHGFYWTESETKYMKDMDFLMLNDDRPRYTEDRAMTRSGLFFSGANNALMGKPLPDGVDDGILTAKEISALDLRGLDLVVLSACQTGLGEITGDGVFGLQRGFKKAGANTLMMSLWKVDDNATQMLMTQFYANLISGKSKFESLREAQRYVREYEVEKEIVKNDGRKRPLTAREKAETQKQNTEKYIKKLKPYQDPKFWAAFILLDAID